MKRAVGLALGFSIGAAACGLPPGVTDSSGPVNSCNKSSDCARESACVQGRCTATSYDLGGLLLQVRINPNAVFAPSGAFLVDPGAGGVRLVSSGPNDQPFNRPFVIKLPAPVSIQSAKVVLDTSTIVPPGCAGSDGSVPADITFFRVPPLAGLPFDPVHASTQDLGTSYAFNVDLVSGKDDLYDVYIEPRAPPGCAMPLPPYFAPGQKIDSSRTLWTLPPVGTLTGVIAGLLDPADWQIDLIEPTRGLPISAPSSLTLDPPMLGSVIHTQVSPVYPGQDPPILRLSPIDAAKAVRPTIHWSLGGANVAGTKANPVVVLSYDVIRKAVNVGGQILGSNGTTGVPSQLTIQSVGLQGDVGGASFSLTQLTDGSAGQFEVPLPPGNYQIRAVPVAPNGLSITDGLLQWPANAMPDCVCGKTFILEPKAPLIDTVTTSNGALLAETTLAITPSQSLPRKYLADTHQLPPLLSRVVTATTDGGGNFKVLLDLGTSDFTVQPDPTTDFPWLVLPQIIPALLTKSNMSNMFALKNPAFLGGTIVDPQGMPVVNAELDAWYPVRTTSGSLTGTVVKIATTTSDANGAYTLVLPSSVAAAE
jgi:hypothetical protein